jgi:hypothetical protein
MARAQIEAVLVLGQPLVLVRRPRLVKRGCPPIYVFQRDRGGGLYERLAGADPFFDRDR